ncbi:uncharacterized protein NFIA_098710 [Aspergillus fischeri NRRL 181]|uniref:Alginate lyase 2 domain-containing protein n=1 Tax=Neosartorya fischeri (strain ATCC 1020 / DSM 3700 / CBS 544.65 / FGSC A1164 / JCM 1740 / NRRL 181 / WB 181) TaxID=331117 RepID=A1DBK1_NEOFI|nr:conserved hypothetical protein [Aspergillus fischeri NRRL 181]EAW20241.1 conserved hypothetical protein [Aspergillus fischeri NRRL 181]
MLSNLFLACLLSSISITAHASQTATITHNHEFKAVQKSPSVIITGPSSLNITHLLAHRHTNTNSPRYKYESVNHNTYRPGDTTFHSFAFSLQEEWQFALRGYYNLARFTAEPPGADRLPGLIWVQENQLYARLVTGTPHERQMRTFSLGSVKLGRWYVVSILVKWGVEGNGNLQFWVDGEKVLEELGVDTIIDDGRLFRFESCGLGRCLGV